MIRLHLTLLAALTLTSGCLLAGAGDNPDRDRGAQGDAAEAPAPTAGLREALRVGVERTVERTAREGGYFDSERIRIPLPPEFQSASQRLRRLGLERQVEDFERTMNRAAETAAREATGVFLNAIRDMEPADALGILRGGEDAATRYLEETARSELQRRYQPLIAEGMERSGVYRAYNPLRSRYNAIPFVPPLELELEDYVTDRALDGLFTVLAEEEARVRNDPVARTTELLRRTFGR